MRIWCCGGEDSKRWCVRRDSEVKSRVVEAAWCDVGPNQAAELPDSLFESSCSTHPRHPQHKLGELQLARRIFRDNLLAQIVDLSSCAVVRRPAQ